MVVIFAQFKQAALSRRGRVGDKYMQISCAENVVMSSVEFKPLLYSSVFCKPLILMSDGNVDTQSI